MPSTAIRTKEILLKVSDLVPASWRGVFIWFIYRSVWQICRQWYEDGIHVGLGRNSRLPIRMGTACRDWNLDRLSVRRRLLGREGVAITDPGLLFPITLGVWLIRLLISKTYGRCSLITGMAAGVSGLFCTPRAAIFCTGGYWLPEGWNIMPRSNNVASTSVQGYIHGRSGLWKFPY